MSRTFIVFFCVTNIINSCVRIDERNICIYGIFEDIDTVSFTSFHNAWNTMLSYDGVITNEKGYDIINYPMSKKQWGTLNELYLNIGNVLYGSVYIEHITIGGIVRLSAKDVFSSVTWDNNVNIALKKNQDQLFCILQKKELQNPESLILFTPSLFYQARPIGFQLFLRLSFIATLLLLLFILYRHTSSQYLPVLAIGIFLAILPLKTDYNTWSMAIMALAVIISFIRDKSRVFRWQPVFFVLCAFYMLYVVGLLYTDNLKLGVRQLDTIMVLIAFPLLFSMIRLSKENVIQLLRYFVWVVIAFCFFAFLSYATIVSGIDWNMIFRDSKLYAPLLLMWPAHPHPSYISTILLMAIPVAFYLRFQEKKHITMAELLPGVLFPIAFSILAGARIGMVIAPFLLGLAYLFYCRFKPWLKWGIVGIGIVAFALLLFKFPKIDDRFVDPIRKDLRTIAVHAIKEKPVLGWGTGYPEVLIKSDYSLEYLDIEEPYPFKSFHSQYLNTVAQFGIPGAIVLLLLIGWLLYLAFRNKDFLLFSLLIIYLLFFWTETVLEVSKGVIPFTFWVCFLVSTQKMRYNQ